MVQLHFRLEAGATAQIRTLPKTKVAWAGFGV